MSMPKPVRVLIPVILVAITIFAYLAWRDGDDGTLVASGTVEATEAMLGFQAPGRIAVISVNEGDSVRQGQEIASLDRAETEARHRQAAAQADAARAILAELEAGSRPEEIAQARALRDAARERMEDATRDLERATTLFEGGALSREAQDKARTNAEVARNQLRQAEEQLRLAEAGPRAERIMAQRAQVAQADAAVQSIDATLNNMIIRPAFDGTVTVRHREPGETVPAGAPVLTVMNREDRWVRIFVPETRIGAVRLGQKAEITADTYPEKTYQGEVRFISSEAEFTPKSVQTTEERVKLVYAVKVQITGDESHDLKPGLPADVRLAVAP